MARQLDHLVVVSYNCRGLNQTKRNYMPTLLSKMDILFLQEHWLSDAQLSTISNIADNLSYTGISGFHNCKILAGRPYGGCAILWKSSLLANVTTVDTDSNRICAARFCCCLLYTSPSPRDGLLSRMPSSA